MSQEKCISIFNLTQNFTISDHFIVFQKNDSFIYVNFHKQRKMHIYLT